MANRSAITTTPSSAVKHLSSVKQAPLDELRSLIKHQVSFLHWLHTRNSVLIKKEKQIRALQQKLSGKGPIGTKKKTYEKYVWYSEQLVLLESINTLETFYKKTFIALGEALREFIEPDKLEKQEIDLPTIWHSDGVASVPSILFEPRLFHRLDQMDDATMFLVNEKRYDSKAKTQAPRDRIKALKVIFQIRHTLSHNHGVVTSSDRLKFKRFGIDVALKEVIDPASDELRLAILDEIEAEATDYTAWLRTATVDFLKGCVAKHGFVLSKDKRTQLESVLGTDQVWNQLTWV